MGVTVDVHGRVVTGLEDARARTLGLLAPIGDADLARQVSPLMSPLVWDLAHVGHYEELWLLRNIAGAEPTDAQFDDIYDAFKHPRRDRPSLPILGPTDAREFVAGVRSRALDALASFDLGGDDPLLRDGFVYGMVIQHEHQHDETMLATIQLMDDFAHPDAAAWRPGTVETDGAAMVDIDGGPFLMGTDDAWAYDNERPLHQAEVAPFRIDRTPVTNGQYRAFVEDGGYDDDRHWSPDGWAWRQETGAGAPQFWRREGGHDWSRRRYGRREELPEAEPVQHVCWYEADAFARWRGARLPSEAEWEKAATAGTDGTDGDAGGPRQMLGGVWEWTATDFGGYPGFASFPYREYSEVFFGPEYKVLRGGSWATDASVRRATFRNWDYPIRRQIFAGFRCAEDV